MSKILAPLNNNHSLRHTNFTSISFFDTHICLKMQRKKYHLQFAFKSVVEFLKIYFYLKYHFKCFAHENDTRQTSPQSTSFWLFRKHFDSFFYFGIPFLEPRNFGVLTNSTTNVIQCEAFHWPKIED